MRDGVGPRRGEALLLGVFVGGASRRMGGLPKGLLAAPDTGEPLVSRLLRVGREAGCEPVIVGRRAEYAAVAAGVPVLDDDPAEVGPLGGLRALLGYAGDRLAVAVACDMPFVSAGALRRLASTPSCAAVVAPRRGPGAPYEPFFARYDPPRVLPALDAVLRGGGRSLQGLLSRCEVEALSLDLESSAALTDWDTPDDARAEAAALTPRG